VKNTIQRTKKRRSRITDPSLPKLQECPQYHQFPQVAWSRQGHGRGRRSQSNEPTNLRAAPRLPSVPGGASHIFNQHAE
jgi:hypothetical protein